jgi:uncharacterized NAD(P)/FAD-binding protein YdhS
MRVGIIGGGFTGCVAATHLLGHLPTGSTVTLFDQHGPFGRGLAYSTGNPNHLLNVRAANMSAFAADRRHFVRWLWRKDDTDHPTSSIPPSGHACGSIMRSSVSAISHRRYRWPASMSTPAISQPHGRTYYAPSRPTTPWSSPAPASP